MNNLKQEPKMIKIRYEEGETGWAEDLGRDERLGKHIYRISNIPLSQAINIDDIVTVKSSPKGGLVCVDEVIINVYSKKFAVKYEDKETVMSIVREESEQPPDAIAFKIEGMVPGVFVMAALHDFDMTEFVKRHPGIEIAI